MSPAMTGIAVPLSIAAGAAGALWMHRRSRLSPRNAYLLWVGCIPLVFGAIALRSLPALGAALVLWLGSTTAAVLGRAGACRRLVPAASSATTSATA
jgi:hypothetical protein